MKFPATRPGFKLPRTFRPAKLGPGQPWSDALFAQMAVARLSALEDGIAGAQGARAKAKAGKFDRRVRSVFQRKLRARTLAAPSRRAKQIAVDLNVMEQANIDSLTRRVRESLKRQGLV